VILEVLIGNGIDTPHTSALFAVPEHAIGELVLTALGIPKNSEPAEVPGVICVEVTVTFPESALPLTVVEARTYPGTVGVPVKTGLAKGAAPVTCATV
jgi:hypothetical protein